MSELIQMIKKSKVPIVSTVGMVRDDIYCVYCVCRDTLTARTVSLYFRRYAYATTAPTKMKSLVQYCLKLR